MEIHLLAIGTRMPQWVEAGFEDYRKRFGNDLQLHLKEIPSPRKSKSEDSVSVCRQESQQLIAAIPDGAYTIALEERGKLHDTKAIAKKLDEWRGSYRRVAFLIGGADGMTAECVSHCRERWSLSPMTFPHALVRVIVAEQVYRAYSMLHNHPYHRV